jgi:tetraacyldisaccharide 4'-kinase
MSFLEKAWHSKAPWLIILWPVSLVFNVLASFRKKSLTAKAKKTQNKVPVIVVGNITVGGTGKTPFVIMLSKLLKTRGLKLGIVSRGYGGNSNEYPLAVDYDSDVAAVGDEALLLLENTDCPVIVDPDRNRAMNYLLETNECDVVISDDGMQHYGLARDMEIAIVDAQRLFSNGFCLPAGPLREPISRLQSVTHVVLNGKPEKPLGVLATAEVMEIQPKYLVNLNSGDRRPFGGAPFNIGNRVQAVTGVGNPCRFYALLEKLPYKIVPFEFPDHHQFKEEDFEGNGIDAYQPVVMTEKDAVKCRGFAQSYFLYLSIDTKLSAEFASRLGDEVEKLVAERA